jgi:hypothetical protein
MLRRSVCNRAGVQERGTAHSTAQRSTHCWEELEPTPKWTSGGAVVGAVIRAKILGSAVIRPCHCSSPPRRERRPRRRRSRSDDRWAPLGFRLEVSCSLRAEVVPHLCPSRQGNILLDPWC